MSLLLGGLVLRVHAQQTTAAPQAEPSNTGTAADQPITPAMMKELAIPVKF